MTNETRQPRDEREAQGGELSEEQMEGAAGGGLAWTGKARGDRAAELSDEELEGAAGGVNTVTFGGAGGGATGVDLRAEGTAIEDTKTEGAAGDAKRGGPIWSG